MNAGPLRPRSSDPPEDGVSTLPALEIHITTPSQDTAEAIAEKLVEERLAACVQVVPGVRSVYRWKGKIESDVESLVLIKTTPERYRDVEARVRSLHPHQVPEIIALPILGGSEAYLAWLREQTT